MGSLRSGPATRAEIVCDPTVMSGDPVVKGTRVPAETIIAYLRAGHSPREIFEDYPSLPTDGIDRSCSCWCLWSRFTRAYRPRRLRVDPG